MIDYRHPKRQGYTGRCECGYPHPSANADAWHRSHATIVLTKDNPVTVIKVNSPS